ncbi:MAG: sigma-54-dependent Fis family transcriptional regulator [Sulfuricella sp.]|nr:sigma-54-dependent Fis family transcriptional regulator [Sulfuricella sp.]
MTTLPAVLIVDDEIRSQESLRRTLEEEFEVFTASGAGDAATILEQEFIHVILCDQRMPGVSGVEFLKTVREQWPDIVRIIISGYTETEDIIAGINNAGIYQYITKPWRPESLLLNVRAAAQLFRLQQENQQASLEMRTSEPALRKRVQAKREKLRNFYDFVRLVRAADSPLNRVCETARRIAPYDISILISGESGTGKELLAHAIHYGSSRADKTFVIENCGALADTLLESELFGHKRGAFTGAYENRVGLFEQADGGTIFLDEVSETTPAFQVKLLRVLQEGEIRPLGSSRTRSVDVRVIAATNRDLEEEVRKGRFREDLYYRLTTFTLHMLPLRNRPVDIAPLSAHLLEEAMTALDKRCQGFTPEALEALQTYHWPGNVRELRNEIVRMLALSDHPELGAELLSSRVLQAAGEDQQEALAILSTGEGPLKERMEELEKRLLKETLLRHRWNKSAVARELGLSRVGLRGKLVRYGMEK